MSNLAIWFDIDPHVYETVPLERANESIHVRSMPIHRLAKATKTFIPQGAVRSRLTRMYRPANTRMANNLSPDVLEVLEDLRQRFRADNERLADEWGVDVTTCLPSKR